MKKKQRFLIVLAVLFMIPLKAQVVSKQDTLAGTPLTLSMDARIENVISRAEENCNVATTPNTVTPTHTTNHKINVEHKPLTTAEICRENPKIMGYKIQIAVVKSNAEARKLGLQFRQQFPTMKVEIDASLRPNYKVLAGSYFKKENTSGDLRRIKASFPDARAIPYRVFCVEAK